MIGEQSDFRSATFAPDVIVNVSRKDGSIFAARLDTTRGWSREHGSVRVVTIRNAVQLTLDEIGLRGLLESAPDATVILSPEGRIVIANQRAAVLFGREPDEMDSLSIAALLSPKHAARADAWFRERYEDALHGREISGHVTTFPLQVLRPNGDGLPVEVAASALHIGEGMMLRAAFRDISDRLRLHTASDQLKTHFLATVSHELRTPLASIIGYTELLDDLGHDDLSDQARHFVDVIGRNAQRELRLVNDLLTVVTIADGGLGLRTRSLDVRRVVLETSEALEPVARAAGVHVTVENGDTVAQVIGDPDRLGQALENLMTNAIKFSPRDTTVIIQVTVDKSAVHVRVLDQGQGIPSHELPHVFEKFYRGAHASATETPGAGLGLTIAQAIVEAHHGSITINSSSTEGTCADVELPGAPVPQQPSLRERV